MGALVVLLIFALLFRPSRSEDIRAAPARAFRRGYADAERARAGDAAWKNATAARDDAVAAC